MTIVHTGITVKDTDPNAGHLPRSLFLSKVQATTTFKDILEATTTFTVQ